MDVEAGMLRGGEPVDDDLFKGVGRHAGVAEHHQLDARLLAFGEDGLVVVGENGFERLGRPPLGVVGRSRFNAVEGEDDLRVHWLLDPERAVVVERGDALLGENEVGASLVGDAGDEVDDRALGGAVVPGRERIVGAGVDGGQAQQRDARQHEPGANRYRRRGKRAI